MAEDEVIGLSSTSFITATDVRNITAGSLTEDDITDEDIEQHIQYSIGEVMDRICVKVYNEQITKIDIYRPNTRDGVNKTFYTQDSFNYYIGDLDADGDIDKEDLELYIWDQTAKTRTLATITSVDENGTITISDNYASNSKMYINYLRSPVSLTNINLRKAVAYLTASHIFSGIHSKDLNKISIEGFTLSDNPVAEKKFKDLYETTIVGINTRDIAMSKVQTNLRYPLGPYL
ncbi:MAG: hypothetical protein WC444_05535 [Candidatus Paceibacterota bacterium]